MQLETIEPTHPDLVYATHPLHGKDHPLSLDLYLPNDQNSSAATVVLFHGGGFVAGNKRQRRLRTGAYWLCRQGFAVVSVGYRLNAQPEDVSEPFMATLPLLEAARDPDFKPYHADHCSLAALEDADAALCWLFENRSSLKIAEPFLLGGFSAGGMTALNLAFLDKILPLNRPSIPAVFMLSGGFGFPSLIEGDVPLIYAQHNPKDRRVSYKPIERLAKSYPERVTLMEAKGVIHASPQLGDGDFPRRSWRRIGSYLQGVLDDEANGTLAGQKNLNTLSSIKKVEG